MNPSQWCYALGKKLVTLATKYLLIVFIDKKNILYYGMPNILCNMTMMHFIFLNKYYMSDLST